MTAPACARCNQVDRMRSLPSTVTDFGGMVMSGYAGAAGSSRWPPRENGLHRGNNGVPDHQPRRHSPRGAAPRTRTELE